ncbi:iron-containing alcohol dehydrogenase family protein [Desulfoplanes formicivorans]|uniref:Alcohol dehydrogenase n=1 Tax=Desulfoplanes formicivorans TaxID=1592317 RepID=A0A194AJR9_9BACT|nr:iron-containing alcohol dehydrogenase family protein [Desulfoplanes formicivorans]GAU09301.1 alcohol dehydrogenase [Desulfoplanes formicivorans]
MSYTYSMPTKVFSGKGCIVAHSAAIRAHGSKAMLVTGRSSAKKNGSQADVIKALEKEGMDYVVFDKVMSNPTIACSYEGAAFARKNKVDCIIAIGGGSPMDAAKAMALLAAQDIEEKDLFTGNYPGDVLPIIAVPTTAGTGSEVTQYSILTNDAAATKTSIATPKIFPKVAYIDPRYMAGLPATTTINTAMDALSHAVEGMLSVRASVISNALAKESIRLFAQCAPELAEAPAPQWTKFSEATREQLAQCALLAGMVIAQTGTTAVHAMGYSLTYFKDIDHGRANGLLLAEYLKFVQQDDPQLVNDILAPMQVKDVDAFQTFLDRLLGSKETITREEILSFSQKAMHTKNIANSRVEPTQEDIKAMYLASLQVNA